ncbi:MAG: alpha-amylase family glycosyl hydrolase, partial [Candidatus Kryptoniota bacterium]
DYTRISFEIVNSIGDSLILDPNNAAVQIPAFTGRGVYFILAPPNSSVLAGTENQIYSSPDIYAHALNNIYVNQDAKATGVFKFAIPLSTLESVMGSFSRGWYFIAYSYLGNTSGAWKVTNQYGGSFFPEQPNIYDAAFFFNAQIEKRNLSNFNYSFNYGGSRYVKLASNYRGALLITPGEISASLASKPYVRILTDGGEIRWGDSVRVFVAVSDSSIHSGLLSNGNTNYPLSFVNDTASVIVTLAEGVNQLVASVQYGGGQTSYSSKVYFNCIINHKPDITILKNISGGTVTLDASATTNPDGLPEAFAWSQDMTNPQPVTLSGVSTSTVSFAVPGVKGDYFFTLTCTTSKDSSYQRVALVVDSAGAHFPDISNWHAAWIDSAIIYEIYVKTFTLDGNFRALTNRIQQIKGLGVNTIWLMPVYPSPQLSPSNPGYVITNYFDINPVYGTLSDFKTFVDSAHANGIRVMMDYVVNHTHNTHPFMLDAIKFGNASPYRGFYSWNPDGTYQYMFTWYDLPSINYDGPDSLRNMNYLINMAKWWMLNYKIDGFRCDVAWGVNDTRKNGPEFWRRWREALKTIKPDAFLLGELDATEYKPPQSYFDRKFDGGYDYLTINALRNALSNNVLIRQLDSAEAYYASAGYPGNAVPMKYIENHDEPRFISQYSLAQTEAAATLELTLPGVPLIYAGQEVGEVAQRGLIDWTDPDNLRPFYQKLISIRRQFKAFDIGKYVNLRTSSPDSVFAFARLADTLSAVVASNLTNGTTTFHFFIDSTLLNLQSGKQYFLNDLISGNVYAVDRVSIGNFSMTLAPYQTAVMILADTGFVTGVEKNGNLPAQYVLEQNYPNPFNPSTNIQFSIGNRMPVHVVLDIFNVLGQKVRTLVDDYRSQGTYRVTWDGKNDAGLSVASGVYFYLLKSNNFVSTKKMLLLK